MTQLSERLSGAGFGQLSEAMGEPVVYTRYTTGDTVASGFPKPAITVTFHVDNRARREYEDGAGDKTVGVAVWKVSDVGSEPVIGVDTLTREDNTVWVVEDVKGMVGGLVTCEVVRYAQAYKGGKRIDR